MCLRPDSVCPSDHPYKSPSRTTSRIHLRQTQTNTCNKFLANNSRCLEVSPYQVRKFGDCWHSSSLRVWPWPERCAPSGEGMWERREGRGRRNNYCHSVVLSSRSAGTDVLIPSLLSLYTSNSIWTFTINWMMSSVYFSPKADNQ